jgi:hypothetical protein
MQPKPERPYIPHLTPKSSPRIRSDSEFRLSRPFVPGGERETIAVESQSNTAHVAVAGSEREPVLRGIEEFLEDDAYDLPPIEHFTDPLPGVETFAPETEAASIEGNADGMDFASPETTAPVSGGAGWVEEDWQRFDWRAAAALGDAPDPLASNDWATTDWDAAAPTPRVRRPSAAHAIASALDQIAQRIRDGDLALPSPSDLGDPAAIAAKLAALLGVRS